MTREHRAKHHASRAAHLWRMVLRVAYYDNMVPAEQRLIRKYDAALRRAVRHGADEHDTSYFATVQNLRLTDVHKQTARRAKHRIERPQDPNELPF